MLLKNLKIETGTTTTDEDGYVKIALTCFEADDPPTVVVTAYGTGNNTNAYVQDIEFLPGGWRVIVRTSTPNSNVYYHAFSTGVGRLGDSLVDDFVLSIETASPGETFSFPAIGSSTYDIDWGDGSRDLAASGMTNHDYAIAGSYTIRVRNWTGVDKHFSWWLTDDAGTPGFSADSYDAVRRVTQWGNTQWTSMESAFDSLPNLTAVGRDKPDLTLVTNMSYMFYSADSFNSDIGFWDVSNVTNMEFTFGYASAFNQDIGDWNVRNVTNMGGMFQSAGAFNQDISSWDVSSVTSMTQMFYLAASFNNGGVALAWTAGTGTSSVITMTQMFREATSFNQDISSWDVSSVTDMSSMFREATSFNQSLASWKLRPAGVTMSNMLNLNSIDVTNYDATLVGWDAYVAGTDGGAKAANTPASVSLGASGRQYTAAGAGGTARANLTTALPGGPGWTISGDSGV